MEYKLICVTNRHIAGGDLYKQVFKVVDGSNKPEILILREKDMQEDEYKDLAARIMKICLDNGVLCILHYFKEVALELGACGIHLPFSVFMDMPGEEKKRFKITGVSVHSKEEAVSAQKMGASYIIAGHIFETGCKEGIKPRGLGFLKEICQQVDIPVYAIGGINMENAVSCIEEGAKGICMMSGFMKL